MIDCYSCGVDLKEHSLSEYVYYHCVDCRLEYLFNSEDVLEKLFFKYHENSKLLTIQWLFKEGTTNIMVDGEQCITVSHIINVKHIEDIPRKIKTYLLFS
jgi:hypothetical protein